MNQLVEVKPGNSETYLVCILSVQKVTLLFRVLRKLAAFLFQSIQVV